MFSTLTLLCLTLLGDRAGFVWGLSSGTGVSARVYPKDHADWDLAEVSGTAMDLILNCESPINPTEWVHNYDDTNITAPKFPCGRVEWSQRWYTAAGVFNQSFVQLRCHNFGPDLILGCRSVYNHSDNVMVKLEENQTTGIIHVTKQRDAWVVHEEPKTSNSSAFVRFSVSQTRNKTYWKCDGPDGKRGRVQIWNCISSSACANFQRKLQLMPVRVEYNTDPVNDINSMADQGWRDMTSANKYPAGFAVCMLDDLKYRGAGVEFFFAGRDKSNLHFSLDEISINDLIWFDPPLSSAIFYTADKFETWCMVSAYGLSVAPLVVVKYTGSLSPVFKLSKHEHRDYAFAQKLSIGFGAEGNIGKGFYEIECRALVWNTSDWATQSLKVEFVAVVPPYFQSNDTEIIVNEGDGSVRLECDVQSNPASNISWSHSTEVGVLKGEREFIITTIAAKWVNGSTVTCTAANKFGQSATKKFRLNVTSDELTAEATEEESGPISISTEIIIGLMVLVIILLTFGLGLGYFGYQYFRVGRSEQALSDQEVEEFQDGKPLVVNLNQEGPLEIECLPYNSEFEMEKDDFLVDFDTELGSGQYGVVYIGHIKRGHDSSSIQIAVKTVRANAPIEHLRALLSELKILAYIGEHEHIAKLMGAYSSNIKKLELYVGIEFCMTSLEKHLRKNSNRSNAELAETSFNEGEAGGDSGEQPIRTPDLIRWAGEIAAGMEYLTTKQIVHADLAARNVLLSFEMHAKICDFGLARQLVNYAYIKKTKCYLPWKWMAIESLRHKHFSTMSDVWSFGVTCWEIFSLGDVPYPCVEWGWEFVDKLEAGHRLKRPRHASQEIFSILLECWFERKERRPSFAELKRFFQDQGRKFANSAPCSTAYVSPDEFIG